MSSTDILFPSITTPQCGSTRRDAYSWDRNPPQLYVRFSIRPLSQQAFHVGIYKVLWSNSVRFPPDFSSIPLKMNKSEELKKKGLLLPNSEVVEVY